MLNRTSIILVLGIVLTFFCESVCAQKTVYKWVDEDGVVHYGEEPPAGESPDVGVENTPTIDSVSEFRWRPLVAERRRSPGLGYNFCY
jgi:hypothetical protein